MRHRALLIGESLQGSSQLANRLAEYGCDSTSVWSCEQASSLFAHDEFDLVFSPLRLREKSMFFLLDRLEGSRATVYFFQPVEDGCWWLPALRFGQKCIGSCGLRPGEFNSWLQEIVAEIQARATPFAELWPDVYSSRVLPVVSGARRLDTNSLHLMPKHARDQIPAPRTGAGWKAAFNKSRRKAPEKSALSKMPEPSNLIILKGM